MAAISATGPSLPREVHSCAVLPASGSLELERNFAACPEAEGELAGRIEREYEALHPVLLGVAGGPLTGWVRELVVAPDELEGRADLHLHLARREPLAAPVALGEISPDTLDGPRQKALDLQGGGLGQHAVGVRGRVVVHGSSPLA